MDTTHDTTSSPAARPHHRARGLRAAVLGLALGLTAAASGQSRVGPTEMGGGVAPLPPEIKNVGIDQNLGAQLPLDVPLVDASGSPVTLGDFFKGDKPVLIEFSYFNCPLLCPMVVSGIVDATRAAGEQGWVPGEQFEILTISFDPADGPVQAAEQKRQALNKLAKPDAGGDVASSEVQAGAERGWHFLTGKAEDVKRITDAAGFRFTPVAKTKDFAHGAVILFASPSGVVTRYLPGHVYPVRDFKLALGEAAEGRQGSLFDMVLQLCYHYDPTLGTYTADAMMLMKMGGVVTVVLLSALIGTMLYFERQRKRRFAAEDAARAESGPSEKPAHA